MRDDLPLVGVTVVDLTRVLAGPYCTRLLADLGARVIKIERPGVGDDQRRGYLQLEPGRRDQSTYFVRVNAGKESVALELGHPGSRPIMRDLARVSDVVVENFVPGVVARLGCDYETLAAARPDLVYCSISGYGQTGPWRLRPAFAHLINAASGMMRLEQGEDPVPHVAYIQAADVVAGTHAFGTILAALWRRARTGRGARIDVSMLESLIATEDLSFGSVLNGGPELGSPRAGMLVQEIGGRYLALQTVGATEIWPRLAAIMDRPELTADPRFATPQARREHWPQLRDTIAAWLKRFASVDEAVETLTAARVPCATVLSPTEIVTHHPHLESRRFFASVPHPSRGTVRITGTPAHLDGQPVEPRGPAPYRVGEHTRPVLEGLLGYPPERVDEILALGAAAEP
jgi:crotonobetainyl-CoA:carnitine CoA-transferase CaiB-like acyl-CoA transferase